MATDTTNQLNPNFREATTTGCQLQLWNHFP